MSPFSLNIMRTIYNSEEKIWSAPRLEPIFNPKASLGHIMLNCLSKAPNNVGQICHEDGFEMRNWEILRDSVRASLNLTDLGLKEGDVLGFAAGNSRNVASVVFGAMLNGNPVGTLDPSMELSDIKHMFGITKPKLVVCDEVNFKDVKGALKELENPASIYVFDVEDKEILDPDCKSVMELLKPHAQEMTFIPPLIKDCEKLPAMIICSSGTTGPPKAIPISHACFAFMFQSSLGNDSKHRTFSFSTLYWTSGVITLLSSTMHNSIRVIVKKPYNAKLFLEIIKERQLTSISCTPAHLQLLLLEKFNHDDLKSIHMIVCAGSAVSPSLLSQFKVFVLPVYGTTEAGGICFARQLVGGIQVKIIDDNGKRLGIGESGEICMKPVFPFLGYYNNPEATKDILKDGFLHTGDIGFFDEDGVLHIVDRKKEIFKYNNFHINPSDVENVLQELEDVALVNVVGIPDPLCAALPAALIIRKEGSKLTEEVVHNFVKANLPDYKFLRGGVYFVKELPMTVSGKVMRRQSTKIATVLYEKNPKIGYQY